MLNPSHRATGFINGSHDERSNRPASVGYTGPSGFYRLKRSKYLVFNMYDATLKIIAVQKVMANIVIHICSSIACQAGAQPVSQPPAPGLSSSRWTSLDGAAADDSSSMRLILKTSETFVRHWQNRPLIPPF